MLEAFADLSTALVADACVRAAVPVRAAPPGIRAVVPGHRVAGRALPVRHYGSVDVFLEVFGAAGPGDVLVIDNGGRTDEACVGDLAVLEAEATGLAGVVVWGLHRDTHGAGGDRPSGVQLRQLPAGPAAAGRAGARGAEQRRSSGRTLVTGADVVFGDDDGVLFVAAERAGEILTAAGQIWQTEREQARRIRAGQTLRQQTDFPGYLARRAADPSYTFRRHLRQAGAAIEE